MDKEYAISQGIELRGKKPPATKNNPSPKGKKQEFELTPELQLMRSNVEFLNFALDKALSNAKFKNSTLLLIN